MATYTALFDACVLYPAPLRDLLVSLGGLGLFRARWSSQINQEWIDNLLTDRPDLRREALDRTRDLMTKAVPDCLVYGYEHLIPSLTLPDPDDCHVLAAAIRGRVDVIVTTNLKDFPAEILQNYSLEAQHPDDFVAYLLDLDPGAVCGAVRDMRARLKNPVRTVDDLLQTLERLGLVQTVGGLQEFKELL